MSPNEVLVLGVLNQLEKAGKWALSKRMDITTDYADTLLLSLAGKGHLEKVGSGDYALSDRGAEEILLEFYRTGERLISNLEWTRGQLEKVDEQIDKLSSVGQGMVEAEAGR